MKTDIHSGLFTVNWLCALIVVIIIGCGAPQLIPALTVLVGFLLIFPVTVLWRVERANNIVSLRF